MSDNVSLLFKTKWHPYKWTVCRHSDEFLMYKGTFRTPPHITQLFKKKKKQKHISRMQLSTEHLLIHRTGSTSCSVAFCTLVLTVWFCACIQKCITWKVLSMRDKCFWRCFQTCYHCIVCNCFKTGSKWLWNGYVNHYVYSLFFGVVVAIL